MTICGSSALEQACTKLNERILAYLSVDDGAAIHEHLGAGLKQTPVIGDVIKAYDSYSWHMVILPFFVAIGSYMLIFLWEELAHRNERIGVVGSSITPSLRTSLYRPRRVTFPLRGLSR